MSENTKIEWADHTFNPWIGCTKVGPGCDNCYAKADFEDRRHRVVWGAGQTRIRTKTWGDPVKWNKQAAAFFAEHGRRQRVFCASLADVFDNEVDPMWRFELWELIEATPNLDWLILTKRIGNARSMMSHMLDRASGWTPPENFWLGATIVNQAEADRDIPKLLAVPAAKRFVSMEPLLGPVDLADLVIKEGPGEHHFSALECDVDPDDDEWGGATVDWVIVGGESGTGARPMHPDWARSLRDQCQASGVPFLFKQWGNWISSDQDTCPWGPPFKDWMWADGTPFMPGDGQRAMPLFRKVSKQIAGRSLDGEIFNGVPA